MRKSGVYRYFLAGREIGREIWSAKPEGDGFHYKADVVRHDVRTETYLTADYDGNLVRASMTRTQPDGTRSSVNYDFADGQFTASARDRLNNRSEHGPWDWPTDAVFNAHSICTLSEPLRRHRWEVGQEVRFPVFMMPRSGQDLIGRFGYGMMRLDQEVITRVPTGDLPCRIFTASFSRLRHWPFHHKLVYDLQGVCHIATGGAMRYELIEMEMSDQHTPLPIRMKSEG
ncbi:hypothetical protein KQI84_10030 [bacterium]|nr:hypothetical protein [bacterium]